MTKEDEPGRRALLKALGFGSGALLALKWSTPIVDSVVIPAHAQASPSPPPPPQK